MHLKSLKQLCFFLLSFATATNLCPSETPENLIDNGSFESASCPVGHSKKWCVYPADQASSQIFPWTVVDGKKFFEIVKVDGNQFENDATRKFALSLTNPKVFLFIMSPIMEVL